MLPTERALMQWCSGTEDVLISFTYPGKEWKGLLLQVSTLLSAPSQQTHPCLKKGQL